MVGLGERRRQLVLEDRADGGFETGRDPDRRQERRAFAIPRSGRRLGQSLGLDDQPGMLGRHPAQRIEGDRLRAARRRHLRLDRFECCAAFLGPPLGRHQIGRGGLQCLR